MLPINPENERILSSNTTLSENNQGVLVPTSNLTITAGSFAGTYLIVCKQRSGVTGSGVPSSRSGGRPTGGGVQDTTNVVPNILINPASGKKLVDSDEDASGVTANKGIRLTRDGSWVWIQTASDGDAKVIASGGELTRVP